MSKAQHTPGPWRRNIKPISRYPIIFAGRNTHVAQVLVSQGMAVGEDEANAELILAAPDLLAALEVMVKAYWEDGTPDGQQPDAIEKACAAIAKARGQ